MNQGPAVLGIDLGSNGIRCISLSISQPHHIVASASMPYSTTRSSSGWCRLFDTSIVYQQCIRIIKEVAINIKSGEIRGIAVTSMRGGMVVVRNGQEVRAVQNVDATAATDALSMADQGDEYLRRTGRWPSPIGMAARLRCLDRADAHLAHQENVQVMGIADWLTWKLSGKAFFNATEASESNLCDIRTGKWLEHDTRLPEIVHAGVLVGDMCETALNDLEMTGNIAIVSAGGDSQCSLLGMGVTTSGMAGIVAGSTMVIQSIIDKPIIDPSGALWTAMHVVDGKYVIEANGGGAGKALELVASLLYERPSVRRLLADAWSGCSRASGVMSCIGAEVFDAKHMSMPIGNLTVSPLILSQQAQPRSDVCRGVIEGIAMATCVNMNNIVALVGKIDSIVIGGGLSQSRFFCQMISDYLGMPVHQAHTIQSAAYGAGMCALVGIGVCSTLKEAVSLCVPEQTLLMPQKGCDYTDSITSWMKIKTKHDDGDSFAADTILGKYVDEDCVDVGPVDPPPIRILVTAEIDDDNLRALNETCDKVTHLPYRETMNFLTGQDLIDALDGYNVLVTEIDVVDHHVIKNTNLRCVVCCRGNPVNIDIDACGQMGVAVFNTPGRNASAVADLCIAMMIMVLRHVGAASAFLRQEGGEGGDMSRMGQVHFRFLGKDLSEMTVGLIGCGAVGRQVLKRLDGFGVKNVLIYDPYADIDHLSGQPSTLHDVVSRSDIVSLHCAVSDETRGIICAETIKKMRPGTIIINTARAALIDEPALTEALKSGHLGGAGLDVMSVEPPSWDHPLLSMNNVIVTPHIGGNTSNVASCQGSMVTSIIQQLRCRQKPKNLLNDSIWEYFSLDGHRHETSAQVVGGDGPTVSDFCGVVPTDGAVFAMQRSDDPSSYPDHSMEKALAIFAQRVCIDHKMIRFAIGKDVMLEFTCTDCDVVFCLGFRDDAPVVGLGTSTCPEVRLKMTAEVLDGLFTGTMSGMRAAMTGKLGFSGDTVKAMTLQQLLPDVIRLYGDVRREMGHVNFGHDGAADRHLNWIDRLMLHRKIKHDVIDVVNDMYSKGYLTSTGGNVSARVHGTDTLWITPTQVPKGTLSARSLSLYHFDGHRIRGDYEASIELGMHIACYRADSMISGVVHSHAPNATALATASIPFVGVSAETALIGHVPIVPFAMPGSHELSNAVSDAVRQGNLAILLSHHGMVTCGDTLRRASEMTEVIDKACQVILTCKSVGVDVENLTL